MARWGKAPPSHRGRTHVGSGTIGLRIDMSPGPDALARAYGEFADQLRDFREVWQELTPVIRAEVEKIFATAGAPLTEAFPKARIPWEDLRTEYARYRHFRRGRKKRRKRDRMMVGPVNRRATNTLTGKLFARLTSPRAARIRPMSMSYGVYSLAYARSVQFGHPMRPFIGRTQRIMGAAKSLLHRRIDKLIDSMAASLGKSREQIMAGA